jgi:hypothetical protein
LVEGLSPVVSEGGVVLLDMREEELGLINAWVT